MSFVVKKEIAVERYLLFTKQMPQSIIMMGCVNGIVELKKSVFVKNPGAQVYFCLANQRFGTYAGLLSFRQCKMTNPNTTFSLILF